MARKKRRLLLVLSIVVAVVLGLSGLLGYYWDTIWINHYLDQLRSSEKPIIEEELLNKVGDYGEKAVPHLIQVLNDDRARVRFAAARLLSELGSEAKLAAPHLVDLLGDDEPFKNTANYGAFTTLSVCDVVQRSLIKIGEPAVLPLEKQLWDSNPDVCRRAASVLTYIRELEDYSDKTQKRIAELLKGDPEFESLRN